MNSKKIDVALPPELSAAVDAAEQVLARYGKLAATLHETAVSIPAALVEERQLFFTDSAGPALAAARSRRADAARARAVASQGLLALGAELLAIRESIVRARRAFAATLIEELALRWRAACDVLVQLHAESQALGDVLGKPLALPLPCAIETSSLSTTLPSLRWAAAGSVPPPVLSPVLSAVGAALAKLDGAGSVIGGLKDAADWTVRHNALARNRGQQIELNGVFVVTQSFDALGSRFPEGALVNRDVLGDGLLDRYFRGRSIRPAEGAMAAA